MPDHTWAQNLTVAHAHAHPRMPTELASQPANTARTGSDMETETDAHLCKARERERVIDTRIGPRVCCRGHIMHSLMTQYNLQQCAGEIGCRVVHLPHTRRIESPTHPPTAHAHTSRTDAGYRLTLLRRRSSPLLGTAAPASDMVSELLAG